MLPGKAGHLSRRILPSEGGFFNRSTHGQAEETRGTSDEAHRATEKIPLSAAELNARIDAYVEAHWSDVVSDIDALVRIPSVEDPVTAASGAPFGDKPREALEAALKMA